MGVISCGTTMIDNGAFQGLAVLSWDTTAKTANFTAVAGNGYFVNTTSASITVTLPSSPSAGDQVAIKDYAATAATNKIVIARNGSNINGAAANADIITNGESATLLYVDGTQGWSVIMDGNKDAAQDQKFITATGGTITTCGDYKIHTFTGPGTFCVSCAGSSTGSTDIDYLIVAGGGGGGGGGANGPWGIGGGGAGGYRETPGTTTEYTASIFNKSLATLTVAATGYPVTVGAGGSGGATGPSNARNGANGSNSVFNSNTSAGGGGVKVPCGAPNNAPAGQDGGSGGGGPSFPGNRGKRGEGNVPAVFGVQGFPGGCAQNPGPVANGGGGGGASQRACDADRTVPGGGGDGGDGSTTGIKGPSGTSFAGGGGGTYGGTGGTGGGGNGSPTGFQNAGSGTANTGGGGGGGYSNGGTGGSGTVIIRYKYQ